MQESFEGDTESPNKRLMKKLGFFHRPSASLFNFLQVLLAFPCSWNYELINYMKQKKFSVIFLNYKVKVQFLVGIPFEALSLVLAFLSKTGSSSTEVTNLQS